VLSAFIGHLVSFYTTVGGSGSVFAKGRDNLIPGVLFLLV